MKNNDHLEKAIQRKEGLSVSWLLTVARVQHFIIHIIHGWNWKN